MSVAPATRLTDSGPGEYRAEIDQIRRRYRRQARVNGFGANGLSLALVTAGAAVGLTGLAPDLQGPLTALLGVAIILLEGVSRVLRPAMRAARARRAARELDREFRLFDVGAAHYAGNRADAHPQFVGRVERILDRAYAEEDRAELDGQVERGLPRAGRAAGPGSTAA